MTVTEYPLLGERLYRQKLENGLQIIVCPKPGFSRKAAYLMTSFGSIHTSFTLDGTHYQVPDGVAHYLEHKLFDLPGRDVNEEFAALGASTNAFTSYDTTAYYFSCTEHFAQCLELLLTFVFTPYFTQETVDKERGIIAQEILMYADSPDNRVFEDLMGLLYAHHPARTPIAGTVESIEAITPEILELCYRAYYNPASMVLCVVGDVEPELVVQMARRISPSQPRAAAVADLGPAEPPVPAELFSRRQMDVAMPTFQLGYKCPVPTLRGKAYAQWELAGELACEALFGESSQLYLQLYEQGLIDPSFGGGLDTIDGLAMVVCGGDSPDPEETWQRIADQVPRLLDQGIDDLAFDRMKKSLMGRRIMDLDSFDNTCFRLCAYYFDEYDYFRFPSLFAQLTKEAVLEFLAQNITTQASAMSVIEPEQAEQ